ncbi:MAG: hypothetical protein ACOH1Y_18385 [Propionicimonas sp.]
MAISSTTVDRPHWLVTPPYLVEMGWTSDEFNSLDRDLDVHLLEPVSAADPFAARGDIYGWLRNSPSDWKVAVSPTVVRETLVRYGPGDGGAGGVLTAFAAGASERFVAAFTSRHRRQDTRTAWLFAEFGHLAEPEATGWALTDYLFPSHLTPASLEAQYWEAEAILGDWRRGFGPRSYLWVLAGFTLNEATAMQDQNATVSDDQLRVMAALNGFTLPASI